MISQQSVKPSHLGPEKSPRQKHSKLSSMVSRHTAELRQGLEVQALTNVCKREMSCHFLVRARQEDKWHCQEPVKLTAY